MKSPSVIVLGFALIMTQGCQQATQNTEQLSKLEANIKMLDSQVESLQQQIEKQKTTIEELRSDQVFLESKISDIFTKLSSHALDIQLLNSESEAILDIKNKKFSTVRTNIGTMFVLVENVEAYMDGSKVTFRIGNPFTTDLSNLTMQIEWNTSVPGDDKKSASEFSANYSRWTQAKLSKEFHFVETMRSGAWNKVSCVLEKLSPQKLGYVKVTLQLSQISLRR